jgi:hypothetical protein
LHHFSSGYLGAASQETLAVMIFARYCRGVLQCSAGEIVRGL